jgi:hypothetical protein
MNSAKCWSATNLASVAVPFKHPLAVDRPFKPDH